MNRQLLATAFILLAFAKSASAQVALDSKNNLDNSSNFEALVGFLGKFNGGFEMSPAISMSLATSKTEDYRAAATLSGFQSAATNDRELNSSRVFVPENSSVLVELAASKFATQLFGDQAKLAFSGQGLLAFKPIPKTETEESSYMTLSGKLGAEVVVGWLSAYAMHNW